jgi:hypothetical protein
MTTSSQSRPLRPVKSCVVLPEVVRNDKHKFSAALLLRANSRSTQTVVKQRLLPERAEVCCKIHTSLQLEQKEKLSLNNGLRNAVIPRKYPLVMRHFHFHLSWYSLAWRNRIKKNTPNWVMFFLNALG